MRAETPLDRGPAYKLIAFAVTVYASDSKMSLLDTILRRGYSENMQPSQPFLTGTFRVWCMYARVRALVCVRARMHACYIRCTSH